MSTRELDPTAVERVPIEPQILERGIKTAFIGGFSEDVSRFIGSLPEGGTHPRRALHIVYRALNGIARLPDVENRQQDLGVVGVGVGRLINRYSARVVEGGDGIRDVDTEAFLTNLPVNVRYFVYDGLSGVLNNEIHRPAKNSASRDNKSAPEMFSVKESVEAAGSGLTASQDVASIFSHDGYARDFLEGSTDLGRTADTDYGNDGIGEGANPDTADLNKSILTKQAIELATRAEDLKELYRLSSESSDSTLAQECLKRVRQLMVRLPSSLKEIEALAEFRSIVDDPVFSHEITEIRDRQLIVRAQHLGVRGEFDRVKQLVEGSVLYSTNQELFTTLANIYMNAIEKSGSQSD